MSYCECSPFLSICLQAIIARTFDYESEAKCDAHLKTFLQSIRAAAASEGQGFAAIKVFCWTSRLSDGGRGTPVAVMHGCFMAHA
jgi:hypothetical protein